VQRIASCSCESLSLRTRGEPTKVSACHCRSCRKRTGSAFSVAVFFPLERVDQVGRSSLFTRIGDSGLPIDFHFCPRCGSTLFWYPAFRPGVVGVAIGGFDDRTLEPTQAVYAEERLAWAEIRLRPDTPR
jgi:hypothetical protein